MAAWAGGGFSLARPCANAFRARRMSPWRGCVMGLWGGVRPGAGAVKATRLGLGPHRRRLNRLARTKYIAPIKIQREKKRGIQRFTDINVVKSPSFVACILQQYYLSGGAVVCDTRIGFCLLIRLLLYLLAVSTAMIIRITIQTNSEIITSTSMTLEVE